MLWKLTIHSIYLPLGQWFLCSCLVMYPRWRCWLRIEGHVHLLVSVASIVPVVPWRIWIWPN
jgi:hypothetical protein